MKYLALDLSTTCTGYARYDDGRVWSGTIEATNVFPIGQLKKVTKETSYQRVYRMAESIRKLMLDTPFDKVIIEAETPCLHRGQTYTSALHGIVRYFCIGMGFSFDDMITSHWKKLMDFDQTKHPDEKKGDKSKRDKQQSLLIARQYVPDVVNDNESDAICLLLAYMKEQNASQNIKEKKHAKTKSMGTQSSYSRRKTGKNRQKSEDYPEGRKVAGTMLQKKRNIRLEGRAG